MILIPAGLAAWASGRSRCLLEPLTIRCPWPQMHSARSFGLCSRRLQAARPPRERNHLRMLGIAGTPAPRRDRSSFTQLSRQSSNNNAGRLAAGAPVPGVEPRFGAVTAWLEFAIVQNRYLVYLFLFDQTSKESSKMVLR